MTILPVGFRVLVRVERHKESTKKGNIMIPETIQDREVKGGFVGTVVALGPTAYKGFDNGEPWVKVGDKVIFRQYSGIDNNQLTLADSKLDRDKGDMLRIINDDDIFGKVVDD